MRIGRWAVQLGLALVFSLRVLAQQPDAAARDNSKRAIKTKVRVVLLEVVATDSKAQPVSGLRQQDFSVFEDGKLQEIISFESHQASPESASQNLGEQLPLATNEFLNAPNPRDSLPLNILLYDVLNTPIADQPFAHQEIVKFLKHKPAGGRYAVFVLGDKLHLLQGFTEDEERVLAALNRPEAQSTHSMDYQSPQQAHETSSQISATLNGASGPGVAAINASTQAMV